MKTGISTVIRRLQKLPYPPVSFREGVCFDQASLPESVVLWPGRQLHSSATSLHDHYVLVGALQRGGSLLLDETVYHLDPGWALLVFPHQHHQLMGLEQPEVLWFMASFLLPQEGNIHVLRNMPAKLSPAAITAMNAATHAYRLAQRNLYAGNETILQMARILNELKARCIDTSVPAHPLRFTPLIQGASVYIHSHLHEPFDLEDIADHLNISESHLRLVFRQVTGRSLGRYVMTQRLTRAIRLLTFTQMGVQEIAEACGFRSAAVFSRSFQRHVNTSPSAYRASSRNRSG